MKDSQSNFTLKYFILLIKILLFSLLSSYTLANDDKIGTVTEINGTIVAINDELEERDLLIHDPFFLNEEIFVTEGSSATIQFNDSTTVIMKELTSINVSEFENSKKNPKLKAELVKGKIIIESGSIAKKDNGEMIVGVTTSSLGLRGTRVDIDLKPSGKSNISLATDSFGNVGAIEVNSDGQTSNITSTEQVLEISENNETTSRDKTDDEKEEAKSVGETLIKSSKIDEEEIIKQLQQKLEDGNLQDANNDGVVDELTDENAGKVAQQIMDQFSEASFDEVVLVYNRFKNAATQIVEVEPYLPIVASSTEVETASADYIFEPSKAEIVNDLLPKSLKMQLYKAIRDSFASEHGARMTAMHKATDNATELRDQLKLTYNKARQAAITNEILEIVGGAEALNS